MVELKPCPFCGKLPERLEIYDKEYIACTNALCPCEPMTVAYKAKGAAARQWNRRFGSKLRRKTRKNAMDWIDNADSYVCPVCRYETNNPLDNNACCPKCGFVPDRFKAPARPEYIERQKAIDAIRSRCAPCGEGIEAVVSVPAADVVQVTRCRNCRYGDWGSEPNDSLICARTYDGFWRSGNDFCSSGKPKEN